MSVFVISYCSLNFTIFLADECETTGGNQPNRSCVFPFSFEGTVYEGCIIVGDDTSWCSTEVDSDGHHVGGEWGYCAAGCLGITQGMFTRK